MRRTILAAVIAGFCFIQAAAAAQDKRADQPPTPHTLSGDLAALMPARIAGDRVVFTSAAVVFAGLWINFMTGGTLAAVVGLGSAAAPAASLATFAVGETVWHGTVWGVGPATILSVGQPVDAVLRDPYATRSNYADALKESGRRAEDLAAKASSYVTTTVDNFLNRF